MENKDNNEILSFEELRRKLGMNETGDAVEKSEISSEKSEIINRSNDDFAIEIEKQLELDANAAATPKNEPVKYVENGKTFVDITSQYVTKPVESEPVTDEVKDEPVKKKRKTFNEMFSDFFRNILPLKKDSTKEKVRKIVMDISVITIVCCIIAFGELYRQNKEQVKLQEEINNNIVDTDDFDDNQYVEAWQELFAQYPQIKFPEGMDLKYSYLYAINQELVGWLRIENTNLNVQVVQTKDNKTYLRRDFYKKYSRYGCPYMDYRNDPKYLDDNTILFGHHMSDGLMFSNLDKYKTLEGYKESPVIEFSTLYETYYFKVFAAFYVNASPEDDNGYFFNFMINDFSTDKRFNDYVEELKKRSVIDTGVSVQPDDKLLTLCTCTFDFHDARFIVVGRMVRENESVEFDTSKAILNPSPKYPQAWYDAKGQTNPYKDDKRWDE